MINPVQRKHKKSGGIDAYMGGIDIYPEIDCFIPEAVRIANAKYPEKSAQRYNNKWSITFHRAMDKMLKKAGLRR